MNHSKKCSPAIRIKGFTDDWEQRKLRDLLTKYEDIVDTPKYGYERLGLKSHAKGIFHSYVEAGKELSTATMHKIAKDKFILNITFAWEHAVAITDVNDEGKLVSHRFPQFSFERNLKPIFFKYIILDKKFRDHLELCSPGGAGRNRVLKIDEMLNYEISFPCTKEQTQIGNFFKQLDETIALHKRTLEKHQNLKKFYLEKMFPKENQQFPEIRFPNFTDAWEQRKLGDYKDVRDGTHSSPTYHSHGYPLITSKNLSDTGLNFDDISYISESDYLEINKRSKVDVGDILLGLIGTIGKPVLVKEDGYAIKNIDLIKKAGNITNNFLLYNLQSNSFNNYIEQKNTGNTQKFLGLDTLRNYILNTPSWEEQTQIGSFFKQLDETIALHKRKVEKFEKIKQAYLEKMFI